MNSTIANITVVASKDYPPEANAGADIIVHLPQNKVTLNGNLSSDDHGITSWEWTKDALDQNKAVDMQVNAYKYLFCMTYIHTQSSITYILFHFLEHKNSLSSTVQLRIGNVHIYIKSNGYF